MPFTEATIRLETSLGGSESALIYLARGLAARGHRVVIYTIMARGPDGKPWSLQYRDDHGIFWFHHEMMEPIVRARQPDVFVSLRMADVMSWYMLQDCKLRILWNEDLLTDPKSYFSQSWQTDLHAFVSEYHRQQYVRTIPDIEPWTWATRNPVDLAAIEAAAANVERDPLRLIHLSRPERALVKGNRSPLLEIFAKLRQQAPGLTLGVCRYHSMYEHNPQVAAICQRADQLVAEAEGVEWLGELNKADLYREIARAALVVYPGVADFAETGCIVATEAQACGTPMVATEIGALPETLHPTAGRLVPGDSLSDEYQTTYVDVCMDLLTDPETYGRAQAAGRQWVRQYDLATVAEEWEQRILTFFEDRFESNTRRVFDACMWHDDLRAARVVADQIGQMSDADPEPTRIVDDWITANQDLPSEYAKWAMDPAQEYAESARIKVTRQVLVPIFPEESRKNVRRILDFAGGNGAMSAMLLDAFPDATVDLVDYSPELCSKAICWVNEFHDGAYTPRFRAIPGSFDEVLFHEYDLVVAGEIAEHFERPEDFCTRLDGYARPGGYVLITVPQGPFGSLMHRASLDWTEHRRGHRFSFEARDIEEMFGTKPGYNMIHLPMQITPRNELCGHFIAYWQADRMPIPSSDTLRKMVRTRPRYRLAVCMIARDNEADIVRALQSVDYIADEVWVADTGSKDRTMELAEPFTRNGGAVWSIGCCPDAPEGMPAPGDFGWARNQSVSRVTADWVLWLDTDEVLETPQVISTYLVDGPFNGHVLRQCHVSKDNLTEDMLQNKRTFSFDQPVRLWRRWPHGKQAGIKYACHAVIHEHFQAGLNELIAPASILGDCDIIHYGYTTERQRRMKCQTRNVPLLRYDRQKYPERELGPILEAREYCNFAKWEKQDAANHGDFNTPVIQYRPHVERALGLVRGPGLRVACPFWDAIWSVYQEALALLGTGHSLGYAQYVGEGKMLMRTALFASLEDYEVVLRDQVRRMRDDATLPPITWGDEEPERTAPAAEIITVGAPAVVGQLATAAGEIDLCPPPAMTVEIGPCPPPTEVPDDANASGQTAANSWVPGSYSYSCTTGEWDQACRARNYPPPDSTGVSTPTET